jgi:hypothetical protein
MMGVIKQFVMWSLKSLEIVSLPQVERGFIKFLVGTPTAFYIVQNEQEMKKI